MSATSVLEPHRVPVPPRALPLRALRGMARRARRREGGLGAGGDRPPLRRPLQPRAARRAAGGRGARQPATSASCSTACARPASRASISAQLAEREDELENRLLAERVTFNGEEMPLRNAQAKLAVLAGVRRPRGARRDPGRGERRVQRRPARAAARDRGARRRVLRASPTRSSATRRRRTSRCATSRGRCKQRERRLERRATTSCARRWFTQLLGDERDDVPSSYHTAWMRRLSPLESTYTKDRATEICLQTLDALGFDLNAQPNIKLDLDDRPQKSPRACVIASDPPKVVHLITRAQGGLHDYQAFLHEAGHALHYAGCDPEPAVHLPPHRARPRADGDLLVHRRGDLARARVARAVLRALAGAGARERRGDDLPRGAALPPLRGEAALRARLLVALQRRRRRRRTSTSST